VIIWINGTFGVGKTTTANLISRRAQWRIFDPEHVGYLLAANLKDHTFDDFQDLPPWRRLVPVVAEEIRRYTDCAAMVAVRTVLVAEYWHELRDGLAERDLPVFHVVLDCEEDQLRRRIEQDQDEPQARDWRLDHIESFHQAKSWLAKSADLMIDTTLLTPDDVASRIIEAASPRLS